MSAVGQELLSTLDQRCTADIEEFAVDTAVLYGNLIKPAIEIVSFSAQIWADQGPRQLGIFLAYFLLSSKWLQVVMPSFGRLTAQQQDLEGVFRTPTPACCGTARRLPSTLAAPASAPAATPTTRGSCPSRSRSSKSARRCPSSTRRR